MAYAAGLCKLVWGGSLFGPTEQWSCSLTLQEETPNAEDPDLMTCWQETVRFLQDPRARISQQARQIWVKANRIDQLGHYYSKTDTRVYEHPGPNWPGGAVSGWYPPQLTLAVSLRTDAKRGRAHVGRFFPPLPVPVHQATDGLIASEHADGMAQAAAEMVNRLNGALGDWRVVVASSLDASVRPVTAIQVGRVMDTQRRRRNSIQELPTRAPVGGAGATNPL